MQRPALATAALLLALAADPAHAEVFRCTSSAGAVTYQQDPCGASETAAKVDVPASFPAADVAARERLFAREAALDQRLEAERERWSRETIAHAMQPAPAPASESYDAPPDLVWWGAPMGFQRHAHVGHRRMNGRPRHY